MAWVRIDDSFPDHPKAVQAGPVACWLYVCGIAYANRFLTDGFIPKRQIWRLIESDDADQLAAALVDAGLWEETDGGYQIHDYLEYQPSAEKVKAARKRNAARQAKWREDNAASNTGSNGVTNEPVTGAPNPSPITTKDDANASQRKPSKSEPFEAFVAMCESTGSDVSDISEAVKKRQLGKAKQLLEAGMTVADIGRCAGYLASQDWRTSPIDMFTIEKERGKWELASKPAKEAKRGAASDGRRADGYAAPA